MRSQRTLLQWLALSGIVASVKTATNAARSCGKWRLRCGAGFRLLALVVAWTAAVRILPAADSVAPTNARPPSILTDSEWAWLTSKSNILVVGVDPSWAAADHEQAPQAPLGMEMDFARRMAEKVGASLRVYPATDWPSVLAAAKRGDVDFLASARRTADKEAEWLFTEPYMDIPIVILVKKVHKGSLTLDEMKNMRLSVGHKFAVEEFVTASYPMLQIIPSKTDFEALLDLSLGDLDVIVMDLATASHVIEQHNIPNLRLAGRVGPRYEFSMACRKDNPLAFSVVRKGLAAISEADRKALRDPWLRFGEPPFYMNRLFWIWVGGVAVCVLSGFLVVMGWNGALKRRVAQTTGALSLELAERKRAETELSRAHSELEIRVQERTAALALANRQLEREVRERRQAEHEVLEISSHERKRIGRDLHDSLGQQLAGVSLLSEALAQRLGATEPQAPVVDTARKISTLINESIRHAKYIVRGLMPVEIVQEGLRHALVRLAEETTRVSSVACTFESDGPAPVHDNDVATNLYRIAQEAINNAIRHGGARALKLRLSADGQRGCLEVEDDGRGMPAPEAPSAGMGLRIMRYRADMCGGELHIAARPGGGVLIRCTFRDHAQDSAGPAPAGPDGQVASGTAPGTAW